MKRVALVLVAAALMGGCSLPPEVKVEKSELYRTNIYSYYAIKESPENVLAALNKEGEVILEAKYRDRPVYIKIMALPTGVQVHVIDR